MKMYRVGVYSYVIEEKEVSKETAATVTWIDRWGGRAIERKDRKVTSTCRWFDTWSEARTWLVEKAERDVVFARRELELAKSKLGNLKGMKDPSEVA
jgi:hypothetical protein